MNRSNLMIQGRGVCGNCPTRHGECPVCGTYWDGGYGLRVEWGAVGPDLLARDMAAAARKAGLPPGAVQLIEIPPR